MPPAHVFKILEESYQANPDQSSDSVTTYLRVRPVLANWLGPGIGLRISMTCSRHWMIREPLPAAIQKLVPGGGFL